MSKRCLISIVTIIGFMWAGWEISFFFTNPDMGLSGGLMMVGLMAALGLIDSIWPKGII